MSVETTSMFRDQRSRGEEAVHAGAEQLMYPKDDSGFAVSTLNVRLTPDAVALRALCPGLAAGIFGAPH